MDLLQFEKEYRVHVYETGPDSKLNLYSLFNYMQDIASDHAIKLGFGRDDLMRDNRFWVLSRIYAEISKLPLWEDSIIIKTWPNGTDKLFALRNYEVRYPDGVTLPPEHHHGLSSIGPPKRCKGLIQYSLNTILGCILKPLQSDMLKKLNLHRKMAGYLRRSG